MTALTPAQNQANYRARKAGLPEPFLKHNTKYRNLTNNQWAQQVCGHTWNLPYINEMSERLWTHYRSLNFLPRGHGKTLRTIALATRHICEKQTPLLIITSGPESKQRIFESIIGYLTTDIIQERYPDIFTSMNRTRCVVKLREDLRGINPDPVLRVAARGSKDIIGSHPAWLHLEDIIQEEFKSDESNEGLQNWFKQVISFCATHEEGKETRITATGTRKAKKDFYQFLIDELKYTHYTEKSLKLIDGIYPTEGDIVYHTNGLMQIDVTQGTYETLNCPKWPLSRLLIEKILKPLEFRTQMQNEPIDPFGNYFHPGMYNEVEWAFDSDTQIVIAIDPAFGKTAGSDNTAIAVLARHRSYPRSYILVEMFAGKIKSLAATLNLIYEKYSPYHILKISCEANYLQKIFVIDKLNKKLPFTIAPFYNKGEKILRIQSLHDPMTAKQIQIWEKCPGKEGFKEELLAWIPKPSTASRKDDRLDALQMGYEEFVRIAGSYMPRSGRTSSQFTDPYKM